LVGRDWVVIATGRARRPETFKKEKRQEQGLPKSQCPFCHIKTQLKPVLVFNKGKEVDRNQNYPSKWTTLIIPNKYPAFMPFLEPKISIEGGVYKKMPAVGYHEVVISKDHKRSLAQMTTQEVEEVINVYQKRYLELMGKKSVNYISIFHNHGQEAGATVSHPHSQLITTPLIDSDLSDSLKSAENYFKKTKKCVYCLMDEWEKKIKTRIVFENKDFLAICPFASKCAFEVIISPKKHSSYFEKITASERKSLAEALGQVLKKLYKGLNDPAYNFYLHSAPCDGKDYSFYHWHWTILPKTSTWAGFEIGTRMEISTITPEKAAEFLRKQ